MALKKITPAGKPAGNKELVRKPTGTSKVSPPKSSNAPKDKSERKHKMLSVRSDQAHRDMLDEIIEKSGSDQSEVIRKFIRQMHYVYSAENADLTVTEAGGQEMVIPLMRNGRPCS
jgi:hypothetical protein